MQAILKHHSYCLILAAIEVQISFIETTQANGKRQMTITATLFIFGICFAPLVAIIIGNIICDN